MAMEIQAAGTVQEVLSQLDVHAARDRQAEVAKARWGWIIFLLVLGATGSLFAPAQQPPIRWPLFGLLFVAVVVSSVIRSRHARYDFENRKLDVVKRFLGVMAQDIPRKAPCSVTIRDGYLPTVDSQTEGNRRKERAELVWLTLEAALHDGTRFDVEIEQAESRVLKLKPGKGWRRKLLEVQETVEVRLRLDAQTYAKPSAFVALGQTQTPMGLQIVAVRCPTPEAPRLVVKAAGPVGDLPALMYRDGITGYHKGPDPRLSGDHLLDLFAHIYAQAANARAA